MWDEGETDFGRWTEEDQNSLTPPPHCCCHCCSCYSYLHTHTHYTHTSPTLHFGRASSSSGKWYEPVTRVKNIWRDHRQRRGDVTKAKKASVGVPRGRNSTNDANPPLNNGVIFNIIPDSLFF